MKIYKLKLTLFVMSLVFVTGFAVLILTHDVLIEKQVQLKNLDDKKHQELFVGKMRTIFNDVRNDVKFLADLKHIRNIRSTNKFDDEINTLFKDFLRSHPNYFQVRVVSFKDGREMFRVDKYGDEILTVPKVKLQNKSDEYYFKEAKVLNPGQVYFSKISLNKEYGEVSLPKRLALRVIAPVFKNGIIHSFLIINVDFSLLFDKLNTSLDEFSSHMVLNQNYLFYSVDKNGVKIHESLDLNDQKRSSQIFKTDDIKNITSLLKLSHSDQFEKKDGSIIYNITKFYFSELDRVKFIAFVSILDTNKIIAKGFDFRADFYLYALSLIVLIGALAFYFSNKFTRPLNTFLKIVQQISLGHKVDQKLRKEVSETEMGNILDIFLNLTEKLDINNEKMQNHLIALNNAAIVVETDTHGVITYANPKFCEVTGYTQNEIIGKTHRIIDSGTHDKEFFQAMWDHILKGNTWRGEVRNRKKDGELYWVDSTIIPVSNSEGRIVKFISIRFDITQRKNIEKQLVLANEKAHQAMQTKANFLANMSHEIRTPLNIIIGMSDILEEVNEDPKQLSYIKSLQKSGQSLLKTVNEILDISKIEAGEMRVETIDFNPYEVFDDTVEFISEKFKDSQAEFLYDIDLHLPDGLKGDPHRLRQILLNLIGNAAKFTSKGHVLLQVESRPSTDKNKVFLDFRVEDTGIGIPEDKLEHIFSEFSQVDESTTREYGGTGLGLNIVKKLTQLMGGDITVTSVQDIGSCFNFSIEFEISGEIPKHKGIITSSDIIAVGFSRQACDILEKQFCYLGANIIPVSNENELRELVKSSLEPKLIIYDHEFRLNLNDNFMTIVESHKPFLTAISVVLARNTYISVDYADKVYIKPLKYKTLMELTSLLELPTGIAYLGKDSFLKKQISKTVADGHLNKRVHKFSDYNDLKESSTKYKYDTIIVEYTEFFDILNTLTELSQSNTEAQIILAYKESVPQEIKSLCLKKSIWLLDFSDSKTLSLLNNYLLDFSKGYKKKQIQKVSHDESELNVLIVDDSESNRNMLKLYLNDERFKVSIATNGEEAYNKVSSHEKYDLIFMDMQMPVMNGIDATQKIRKWEVANHISPSVIIALTANVLPEDKEKALNAGSNSYLTKPLRKADLIQFIANYSQEKPRYVV